MQNTFDIQSYTELIYTLDPDISVGNMHLNAALLVTLQD